MSTQTKVIAGSVLLAGMITLTGCSSNHQESATPTTSPTEMTTATSQPEISSSTSPMESTPVTTPSTTDANQDSDNASSAVNSEEQLTELLEFAKKGLVPGVAYAAHTSLIDEVVEAWGEPDKQEPAGKGIYATYDDKNVVFGFNKDSLIFDVRSSDSTLHKLTLNQIEETLGKPDDTKVNGEDKIYTYTANDQYQLKFIIPDSTGTVGHISVFSEQDSFNNMAG